MFRYLPQYIGTLHCGRSFLQFFLKDKSGVDEIIVKKQPYQLLNTNHEFFPSFDASFINWLMNLRKLGQISSPFCILFECVKVR